MQRGPITWHSDLILTTQHSGVCPQEMIPREGRTLHHGVFQLFLRVRTKPNSEEKNAYHKSQIDVTVQARDRGFEIDQLNEDVRAFQRQDFFSSPI